MQGGRGGRDDPFGGFGGFGDPFGGFGGFGDQRSLISSFFSGRDPFDDPFFTRPFGSNMFGSNMFGSSMFGPTMLGPNSNFFGQSPTPGGFIDNQLPSQGGNRPRGPIIEELSSGDEGEEHEKGTREKKENPRKHSRSGEPYVEEPDDGAEERRIRHMQHRNQFDRATNGTQPQTRSFSFQSSSVTYGGTDGAYYSSSTTRKMGDNGVMIEEKKEADTTTGKAEHRVSKGIRDKGHSVTRKLNPDGEVDTMQTLHNLNEDELARFEETWKDNAKEHLPGWTDRNNVHENIGPSSNMHTSRQGWALPSTERPNVPNKTSSHKAKPYKGRD